MDALVQKDPTFGVKKEAKIVPKISALKLPKLNKKQQASKNKVMESIAVTKAKKQMKEEELVKKSIEKDKEAREQQMLSNFMESEKIDQKQHDLDSRDYL